MASATLHRANGECVSLARVIVVAPTSVSFDTAHGERRTLPWHPAYDRLEWAGPDQVISRLESALARALGTTVDVIRLQHGYDATGR
jgi:hypothetical protein